MIYHVNKHEQTNHLIINMTSCNSNQTKSPRSQTSAVAIIRTISSLS